MLGERRARWHCGILPSILVPGGSRLEFRDTWQTNLATGKVECSRWWSLRCCRSIDCCLGFDDQTHQGQMDQSWGQTKVSTVCWGIPKGGKSGWLNRLLASRFGVKTGLEVQQKNQVDYPWATWPDRDFVDADLPAVPGGAQSRVSRPTHLMEV